MKVLRHLILILLFAGLVSLEIWHGIFRVSTLTRTQRDEALESIRRGQAERARAFNENLRAEREHAGYLVKVPGVRALLRAGPDEEEAVRRRLWEDLLPYHKSFLVIDSMSLFDGGGRERFRMIRQGGGVAGVPAELLGQPEMIEPVRAILLKGSDEVALSRLEIESARVYVPESKRQILRYAALVRDREPLGVLVLTLYAAPLLDAIRDWRPGPGTVSALVDSEGRYLAHPDRRKEMPGDAGLLGEHPSGGAAILQGGREAQEGATLLLSTPVTEGLPGWRLVAMVPKAAIEATAAPIRGEYAWVIGSMAATTVLILAAGAFLLRLSIREVQLAESTRYLERIGREMARYRALMEGAADMILIVSPGRGVIREANAMAREALGLPQGESPLDAVVPAAHLPALRDRLAAAAGGLPTDLPEIRLHGPGGKEIPASGRLAAIDLEDERVVEVALRDLTRQKEMERQLRISERLGSLGLLTAGVAHEINNPLEGIENYLTLLERDGGEPARRARYLEMLRYGFRRIRDIVRDLSSFARPEVKGSTAGLNEVVDRALGMVRYDRAFRTVAVEKVGFGRPLAVLGDAGRIEQVFINLLVNAARAMGAEGKVVITALPAPAGPESGEPVVEVLVEDNGPGIPEENLGRIFDPFFTTGEGSGLGLSISYGIMRALGGDIRAGNRPEGGARFVLRIPAAGPEGAPPAAGNAPIPPAPPRNGP